MLRGKIVKQSDLTTVAEFRPGFFVTIRHMPDALWLDILKKSTKKILDQKTRQYKDETDNDLLHSLVSDAIVVDWEGLTPEVLRTFMEVRDPDPVIPYSSEDAQALIANSLVFQAWCLDIARSLEVFVATEDAKRKKDWSPTPNGRLHSVVAEPGN